MTLDGTTALVIIIVILAVVALAAIWRYRGRIDLSLQTGKTGLTVKGENASAPDRTAAPNQPTNPGSATAAAKPGVNIRDAKSGGGILAEDKTGKGVNIERVETQSDILASSETPPAPKA
jgi:hypothetical protein